MIKYESQSRQHDSFDKNIICNMKLLEFEL